jgi:hypothetical protein
MKFLILLMLFSFNVFAENDYKYGYMIDSCAPKDGASITLSFFIEKQKCKNLAKYPRVSINWWKDIPTIPIKNASYIFKDEKAAIYSFCPFKSKCKKVKQFGLHLENVTEKKVKEINGKGNFILKKSDDKFLKSTFELFICPKIKEICG